MKADSTDSVITTWGLTAGGMMIAQIHTILGIGVLILSASYTIWRWWRDIKKEREQ